MSDLERNYFKVNNDLLDISRRSFNISVVYFTQKVIPKWLDMAQSLQYNVAVIIRLDVIQTNNSRKVHRSINSS